MQACEPRLEISRAAPARNQGVHLAICSPEMEGRADQPSISGKTEHVILDEVAEDGSLCLR